MVKSISTEQKILDAARIVFEKKGMAGARMQEIADEAGINKALLHYYYRSKDKLFDQVFLEAFKTISSGIEQVFGMDIPVMDKFKKFIELYINVLRENPYLPAFVLGELNQNPERLQKVIKEDVSHVMGEFISELMQEVNQGKIVAYHPAHLMLNLISMLVFPFVARPLISPLLKEHLGIDYDELLEQRKEEVFNFVYRALKVD